MRHARFASAAVVALAGALAPACGRAHYYRPDEVVIIEVRRGRTGEIAIDYVPFAGIGTACAGADVGFGPAGETRVSFVRARTGARGDATAPAERGLREMVDTVRLDVPPSRPIVVTDGERERLVWDDGAFVP